MGAGEVVGEGREKGVGGRTEYCVGLRGGPPVVVLGRMGGMDVTGARRADPLVVASEAPTGIV